MNWKCPVCRRENENRWKCNCGFEESKNYEKYRVIMPLSEEKVKIYMNQKGDKDSFYEMYIKEIPVYYLKCAAELGNLEAQYELGKFYYDGVIEQDIDKAFYWWNRAMSEDTEKILNNKLGIQYIMQSHLLSGKIEKEEKKENGKIIQFGNREWLVLDIQENKALIITKDIVGTRPYNEVIVDTGWRYCTLRAWLNGEFLEQNFSTEEMNRIEDTLVRDSLCKGEETKDKAFCLSINEAEKYFLDNEARAIGAWWWLRSSGDFTMYAAGVSSNGLIDKIGSTVNSELAVRPALWLNLKS